MGTVLITLKIMPESPDSNLEEIKSISKDIIEKGKGKLENINEEPIAFGLKAVIISFALDESLELESIEEALKKVQNVSSVQVIDMRRAFG